jgi:hypothetical protein
VLKKRAIIARHHVLHGADAVVVAPDRDDPAGPPQDNAVERREVEPVHGLSHRDEVNTALTADVATRSSPGMASGVWRYRTFGCGTARSSCSALTSVASTPS